MGEDIVDRLRSLRTSTHPPTLAGEHLPIFDEAAAEITKLRTDNERLEKMLEPRLERMSLDDSGFNMALAGPAVEHFAMMLTGWFIEGGAKNYVEMTVNSTVEPFDSFVVTVQKRSGKTPHQMKEEAVARASAIREEAAKCAEAKAREWYNGEATTVYGQGFQTACNQIAQAIRSLELSGQREAGGGEKVGGGGE